MHGAIKHALGKPWLNDVMTPITLCNVDDETAWDEALTRAGGAALQQDWSYGEIARAAGRRVWRISLWHGSRRIGQAQVIARAGMRVLNRGPVWEPGVTEAALRQRALRALARRGWPLLATPDDPVSGSGLVPLITPRHHAIWDLTPSPDALRAGLSGKWRNRLSGAERAGLRVCAATDWGWILRAEAEQQRRRGYRNLPAAFVAAWARDGVVALEIRGAGGAPMAGMIFLRHGQHATYQTGWIADAGRLCGAHQMLMWHAAQTLRAQDVRRLDLGAVDSAEGAGRLRFKLGTGAKPRALGATCLVLPG